MQYAEICWFQSDPQSFSEVYPILNSLLNKNKFLAYSSWQQYCAAAFVYVLYPL